MNKQLENNKGAGRPKGSQNKLNAELRKRVNDLLGDYFDKGKFESDLKEMEAKDRAGLMIKLVDYSLPKLKSIEVTGETEREYINIIDLGGGLNPELEQFDDFTTDELKRVAEQLKLNKHGN